MSDAVGTGTAFPLPEKLRELGMDLPEVLEVIEEAKKKV